jgi:hypothetical protein
MDEEQPTYRFKWSNIDLDRFVENRRAAAVLLRREAAKLTLQAEQIEEEVHQWKDALEEVTP